MTRHDAFWTFSSCVLLIFFVSLQAHFIVVYLSTNTAFEYVLTIGLMVFVILASEAPKISGIYVLRLQEP